MQRLITATRETSVEILPFIMRKTINKPQYFARCHKRHARSVIEGPYIFACNYIVGCCVRR